jgi:hypothetical protein
MAVQRGARGIARRSFGQAALFFGSFLLGNRNAEASKEMNGLTKLNLASWLIRSKNFSNIFLNPHNDEKESFLPFVWTCIDACQLQNEHQHRL